MHCRVSYSTLFFHFTLIILTEYFAVLLPTPWSVKLPLDDFLLRLLLSVVLRITLLPLSATFLHLTWSTPLLGTGATMPVSSGLALVSSVLSMPTSVCPNLRAEPMLRLVLTSHCSEQTKCWCVFLKLDLLFERKISARKFASTHVNAFDVALHHEVGEDKVLSDHVEKV